MKILCENLVWDASTEDILLDNYFSFRTPLSYLTTQSPGRHNVVVDTFTNLMINESKTKYMKSSKDTVTEFPFRLRLLQNRVKDETIRILIHKHYHTNIHVWMSNLDTKDVHDSWRMKKKRKLTDIFSENNHRSHQSR